MALPDLSKVCRSKDFYKLESPGWVTRVWRKQQSLEWFLKNHRGELLRRQAAIRLGRDYFLVPEVFIVVALDILTRGPKDGA